MRRLAFARLLAPSATAARSSAYDGEAILESALNLPSVTRAGQRQTWYSNGDASIVEKIDPAGSAWDWADALAPRFELDGRTAREFLDWVALQTGHRLEFASDRARLTARNATFRGSGFLSLPRCTWRL